MNEILATICVPSLVANVFLVIAVFCIDKENGHLKNDWFKLKGELWRLEHKKYRHVVRFLNPAGMPQNRLDKEIEEYQDTGWTFDKTYSVNGLLAFYRDEEIEIKKEK